MNRGSIVCTHQTQNCEVNETGRNKKCTQMLIGKCSSVNSVKRDEDGRIILKEWLGI
jgi:hypothetical protein